MSRSSLSLVGAGHPAAGDAGSASVAAGLPALIGNGSSELVPATVNRVLEQGHRVFAERPYTEVLNQVLCQEDVRDRVLSNPRSSFSQAVAVARLVWHLGGHSDLGAIEFYEPRARLFSDDGNVLSGSNTGSRIFGGSGGVDQLRGLISRLAEEPASRRAMAVVWRPEDATRISRDIPCTLAIACHLREGRLLTTVTMRSNNALRLLPYNLFEFTMLAELVAVELGVEPGPYWHSVLSLHVFDEDADAAGSLNEDSGTSTAAMSPMPGPHPLAEAARLVEHERELRLAFATRSWDALPSLADCAAEELHPYWFGLYSVLALFCSNRARGSEEVLDRQRLEGAIPPALRPAG